MLWIPNTAPYISRESRSLKKYACVQKVVLIMPQPLSKQKYAQILHQTQHA